MISLFQTARGSTIQEKLDFAWRELQGNVDRVLDKDMKAETTNKVRIVAFLYIN